MGEDMSWIPTSSPSAKFVQRCGQTKGNGEAFRKLLLREGANPCATELLAEMLKFDPSRRMSVEQALDHRYVAAFKPSEDPEVDAARAIGPVDWSFDRDLCFDDEGKPKPFDVLRFRAELLKTCTRVGDESHAMSDTSPSRSPVRHRPRVERNSTSEPAGGFSPVGNAGYTPAGLPAVPPAGAREENIPCEAE